MHAPTESRPHDSAGQRGMAARGPAVLLVFLAALVYFLLFHRYGFFLQDEGVIAYQALRVARGEVPYADFQTAYTPASYYLHALLFQLFGTNLAVLRAAASIACAATAALLFLAASQVVSSPYAVLPSLLYVLLEDQESRGLLVHTIPYPARYITTLWALSLCLTLAHGRRPGRGLAAGLGLVTAAIAALKHTAGIYNAWAVGLSLVLIGLGRDGEQTAGSTSAAGVHPCRSSRRAARRLLGALPSVFLLAVLVALPVLFGGVGRTDRKALLALCLPLAAAVLLLLRESLPWGPARTRRGGDGPGLVATGSVLAWFGLAATLPTLLWVLYFGTTVGFGVLGQRLIFDGPAVARSYAIPFPPPGTLAVGMLVLMHVAIAARVLVARGIVAAPTGARAFALVSAALALAACAWTTRFSWHTLDRTHWSLAVTHLGRQLDNLGFYLAAVAAFAFLPRLYGWLKHPGRIDLALVCWVHGVCQLLLAYPRLDVAHLYEGIVTLLVVGTLVLARTVAFFGRASAPAPSRWLATAVVCAVALVAATKVAPRVVAQVGWRDGPVLMQRTGLQSPRGGLYGTAHDAGWFAALDRTIAFISDRTSPDTPIFAFPALSGIYFLSGRDNPSPMDYFHQGFGEGSDEVAVITALEATQTPLVILMTDYSFDPTHEGYFAMLKDYVRRHFVQTTYFAPFRVLERVRQ